MTNDVDRSAPYADQNGSGAAVNPGKTMGIVGLVLGIVGFVAAFVGPIAGLIVSIIGRSKSKAVGQKNGIAVAGIIVSIVALIANIIAVIVIVGLGVAFGGAAVDIVEQCQADPTQTVEFQGQQLSCEEILQGTN